MLAALLFAVCACEGEPGVPGRDGRDGIDGRDGATLLNPILINVPAQNWVYTDADDNNFFYATVELPELTEDIFDFGLIKMYRTFDYDTSYPVQAELPYTRHFEYDKGNGTMGYYTETVDYEIEYDVKNELGLISIYYTVSDFEYDPDDLAIPGDMQFRCVLML